MVAFSLLKGPAEPRDNVLCTLDRCQVPCKVTLEERFLSMAEAAPDQAPGERRRPTMHDVAAWRG